MIFRLKGSPDTGPMADQLKSGAVVPNLYVLTEILERARDEMFAEAEERCAREPPLRHDEGLTWRGRELTHGLAVELDGRMIVRLGTRDGENELWECVAVQEPGRLLHAIDHGNDDTAVKHPSDWRENATQKDQRGLIIHAVRQANGAINYRARTVFVPPAGAEDAAKLLCACTDAAFRKMRA